MRHQMMILLVTVLVTAASGAIDDGLVAYWSFDDSSAVDVTGRGHDGIEMKDVTYVEGLIGRAARFGGGLASQKR